MRSYQLSITVIVGILLCSAPSARAHAIVLSATPSPQQVVKGPDIDVKLRFNSRIDAKRSRLRLVAPNGEQLPLAISDTSSPDSLLSQAKGLKGGAYTLRWQVLAADGHITQGEVSFRVKSE